ncbi:MAG: hypothetical protein KBE23_03410 [Chloroflexi bacterium]|nr:hypothetical protein [Chloroflexota bacterium]MBP7041761.1 hypothetical protein [Chloroflexota bacterium]
MAEFCHKHGKFTIGFPRTAVSRLPSVRHFARTNGRKFVEVGRSASGRVC